MARFNIHQSNPRKKYGGFYFHHFFSEGITCQHFDWHVPNNIHPRPGSDPEEIFL